MAQHLPIRVLTVAATLVYLEDHERARSLNLAENLFHYCVVRQLMAIGLEPCPKEVPRKLLSSLPLLR